MKAKKKFIQDYKMAKGCNHCGYNEHFSALDLDHIIPGNRNPKLTHGNSGKGWEKLPWGELEVELEKCQVLCANCHRIKTHMERDHLCKH